MLFNFCFKYAKGSELSGVQRRSSELSSRISELEETLSRTQRELARAQENNAKLQRDLRENQAQKVDQVLQPIMSNFLSHSFLFINPNLLLKSPKLYFR